MKKYFNILVGALLTSMLATTYSCKDDKWDDHYKSENSVADSKLLSSLQGLGYGKLAQKYVDADMGAFMNSGLQFNILAVNDDVVTERTEGMSKEALKRFLLNTLFVGAYEFKSDSNRVSLMNEKVTFVIDEDSNYVVNQQGQKLKFDNKKINQEIYNAVVHEATSMFQAFDDVDSYIGSLDSIYSHIVKRFYWDTLYYTDGSQQMVPVYENGILTVANARQLKFLPLTINPYTEDFYVPSNTAAQAAAFNAEKMSFLMTKNVSHKMDSLESVLTGAAVKKFFAGFAPYKEIRKQISQDSVIYISRVSSKNDSLRFRYYTHTDTTKSKYFTFAKDQVALKELSSGNKIYYIDSILGTPKYLSLLQHHILSNKFFNAVTDFGVLLPSMSEDDDAYKGYTTSGGYKDGQCWFTFPKKTSSATGTPWLKFDRVGFAGSSAPYAVRALLHANASSGTPRMLVGHWFQARIARETLNSSKYQLRVIYVQKSPSQAMTFSFSALTGTYNKDSIGKELVYSDSTLLKPIFSEDDLVNQKNDTAVSFGYGVGPQITVLPDSELSPAASVKVYQVKFEPFEVKSYLEDVFVRFTVAERPNAIGTSNVQFYSLQLVMVDDEGNPIDKDGNPVSEEELLSQIKVK